MSEYLILCKTNFKFSEIGKRARKTSFFSLCVFSVLEQVNKSYSRESVFGLVAKTVFSRNPSKRLFIDI